ncbi:MAG: putative lipoprotein [Rhodospirillaceae bacterium]|nr:MAG: putative lipoprotein [Rhodospirillaceae bacterium]
MENPFARLRNRHWHAMVFAALTGLAACTGTDDNTYIERPVEQLYNEAMNLLEQEERQAAAKAFDEVERQHPYSVWATKAQLMAAYAYYDDNKYDDAVIALDRFIQLHPGHRDVSYAYYMKGLCYYEQITDVARDQKMTELATEALREVATRFPNSQYARDARLKLDLTNDHLAGKEMEIGRFYMKRFQYLAAISRFRMIVAGYQTTTHVPEALHRLVEAYTALGLSDEARKTAAVLGHNFPGSPWYQDSYQLVEGITTPSNAKPEGWLGAFRGWLFNRFNRNDRPSPETGKPLEPPVVEPPQEYEKHNKKHTEDTEHMDARPTLDP